MRRWGWVWLVATIAAATSMSATVAVAQDDAAQEGSPAGDDAADDAEAEGPDGDGDAAEGGAQGEDAEPQAEPTEEEKKLAREAYARGEELFREGEFEQAEAAFERAYEAIPNAVVLVSIAEARDRRGDVQGAIEAYSRYLEERPDAPDAAKIQAKLEKLSATPGRLTIESDPPEAKITLDGEPLEQTTPAELEVEPGEHTVAVSMQGYDPSVETVEVAPAGEQKVTLELEPAAAEQVMGTGEGIVEPPAEAPADEEGGEAEMTTGVWVAAGVAAAGLVSGTVLGFMALSEESDFNDEPTDGKADRGERFALFADVAFGVAAAAAITGLVLYFTGDTSEDDDATAEAGGAGRVDVAPAVGRNGGGGAVRVSF